MLQFTKGSLLEDGLVRQRAKTDSFPQRRSHTDSFLPEDEDIDEGDATPGAGLESGYPSFQGYSFTSTKTASFEDYYSPGGDFPMPWPPMGPQGLPLGPPPLQPNSDSPRFLPTPFMPGAEKEPPGMTLPASSGAETAQEKVAKLEAELMKAHLELQQERMKAGQPPADPGAAGYFGGMPPGAMMPGMPYYGGAPHMFPGGMVPPGWGGPPMPADYWAGMAAGGPMAAPGGKNSAKKGRASVNSVGSTDSGAGASKSAPKKAVSMEVAENDRTTTMLRNLPNNLTRSNLLEMLDAHDDLKAKYDFVYLPMDFQRTAGLGYAFVNWVDHTAALKCWDHFDNFTGWSMKSEKVCEVAWGDPLQGKDAHIDRYRNSPVMHDDVSDEYKPVLFENGVRVDFPGPTKRIRPPRLKSGNKAGAASSGFID